MKKLLLCFCLQPVLFGAITYSLRDARFFGDTTGRETTDGGVFGPATSDQLFVNFSTGGGTPVVFNGVATTQAAPFVLGVSNHVNAGSSTTLTANTDFVTPISIVSLAQSVINETGVVVTGGSGTGYLLPTFRVRGSFMDTHPTAFASLAMCAGVNLCTLTGVANSTGPSTVDTLFTPAISTSTDFSFDTPFTFFFFISGGINSFTQGNLAPGELSVDFTNGLELVSVAVVDANGVPIPGAVVHSEFLDRFAVPEPGTFVLMACGVAVVLWRRRIA